MSDLVVLNNLVINQTSSKKKFNTVLDFFSQFVKPGLELNYEWQILTELFSMALKKISIISKTFKLFP